MGTISSRYRVNNHTNECLICWDKIITNNFTKCLRCNIVLHDDCEETYRNVQNYYYCKCPHCQRIGSLGSITTV
jgi:hypothetical protein